MNSTERIYLQFPIADRAIAAIIASAKPPEGVTVGKPANVIKASATGGAFVVLAIDFIKDCHDLGLALLAAWLYDCFAKSGIKEPTVNNEKCVLSERGIRRIIKNELKRQRDLEKQYQRDKKPPAQKRR
jgi:hypothetical protein